MKRWRAVAFDLDDTLYPEREYVLSGMWAVAVWVEGQLGFPAERSFTELRQLFEEGVRGDTFNRWLAGHHLETNKRVQAMVEAYRRHEPQIAPYAEARELLRRLSRGYRLGLVTDGYLEVQQRKLAALNLGHYFQAVVYSDALGRDAWKPSPRPFEEALERLSVAGGHAVYVADNPTKDFRGARQVGMGTIRVCHPEGLYRDLQPHCANDAPDMEVPGLGELEDALLELGETATPGRPWHTSGAGARMSH